MSGGPDRWMDRLPDELLSRILVAAAPRLMDGRISLPKMGCTLSRVCKRWRSLCLTTGDFWETLWLTAPLPYQSGGPQRNQWLDRKLWLLQRIGGLLRFLRISDDHVAQGLMQPLLQAAPRTLRALELRMRWGAHMADLPQLLALARSRFTSLERLELTAQYQMDLFHIPNQSEIEAWLPGATIASVAALGDSLAELRLDMPAVELPSLAPLTALRRLRQLRVMSRPGRVPLQVPAPAQFPCLEAFDLGAGHKMQLLASQAEEGPAGHTFAAARWAAAPAGTLTLAGVELAALPELLAALRPPAAGPLGRLVLRDLRLESGAAAAAAAAAAVEACAPHLEHLQQLGIAESACAAAVLEPLMRHLPPLESLQLTSCGLRDLPAGLGLSRLRSLNLALNSLQQLPRALLRASQLQTLSLYNNLLLQPSEPDLRQLLQALPQLQQLDLRHTGITEEAAEALQAAAAERGTTVQLPDFKPPQVHWWSDEDEGAYYSSTSDSSDDGCPRYSWAGCAYASRW